MARSDAGAELTDQHRRAQVALRAAALRDYLALWPLWQDDDERSFGVLVAAAVVLVRAYHQFSSSLAGSYFAAFRREEDPGGFASPRLAAQIDADRVASSLYVTGRVMTRKALQAGKQPPEARRTALVRTSGAVTRHVLQGGRDTIVQSVGEDPRALTWARVTTGTPCAFCAMLAGRGAVFLGESTAEFEAHDHCSCTAEPHYDGSAIPPDSERWRTLYTRAQREARRAGDLERGTSNDALNALRRLLVHEGVPHAG